jgi:asparagine synthase (glutamine-hydrolysing)
MCGIAGIASTAPVDPQLVARMAGSLAHRGPDDQGVWLSEDDHLGLGHRRLAIVDLSPQGHQPMTSHDGRWVLCFNGEFYNHAELRAELQRSWRGHSDTEVFLEAVAEWGVKRALERSVGMFAISLYDKKERCLYLARDRFGEKPLYFGWAGRDLVFGSELKALRQHPAFDNAVDRQALRLFASRLYVPAPLSIYERIYKLEPASILKLPQGSWPTPMSSPPRQGLNAGGVTLEPYWSYRDVVTSGLANPIDDETEVLERLEQALADAIRGQSRADVPVGAFLSGGIDSSAVVALYQKYSQTPIRTFTIGLLEERFNEAPYAKKVAEYLGTEHHEHYVTAKEAQGVIPSLPAMFDEPFADNSMIPTYLVSRLAREKVTVALSGDGGDELFGGYNRYFGTALLWSWFNRFPSPIRTAAGRGFGRLPAGIWEAAGRLLPGGRRPPYFGVKVQKTWRTMGASNDFAEVFHSFLDEWSGEQGPVLGGAGDAGRLDMDIAAAPDAIRMMYCDSVSYLPDDILCKVDRAAMAVSLETRVPFLDHRVAELAARIPVGMKIREGRGKLILRKMLYREVPPELFERPKAGFGIPVGDWLKGPLRDWAESLLDERRLREDGFFDVGTIRNRWEQHLRNERDGSSAIWAVLMFNAWNEERKSGRDLADAPAELTGVPA